jgi:hypothetical protein
MENDHMIQEVLNAEVYWERVTLEGVEYVATLNGNVFKLRMNDFPDEPLYTVTFGNEKIDLDDTPDSWHFPWKES